MDLDARAVLDADPDAAYEALADLATYPHWLTIVASAAPVAGSADSWSIELVGRIGPFTRKKRVRMVRTEADRAARTVRFERQELDGKTHNAWILTGSATETSEVHVHLHYGGGTLPGADLLLRQEIRGAGHKLQRYLDSAETA